MPDIIEARVLKGFRDFLPEAELERRLLVATLEKVFLSFGFVPIDTPALEYAEILLGKGGGETEKQVYRFLDHGGRDVALRFDLTVPFARFMAEHRTELTLPFKRYHIAKVWRGENTQRGRYREFTQCDFDIVGTETAAADFEILLMMRAALRAIHVGDVSIRMSHRGVFNRFLSRLGLSGRSVEILRTVDKLAKIGREETLSLLSEIGGTSAAEEILAFIEPKASYELALAAMRDAVQGSCPETDRLELLRSYMTDAGVADVFVLDPSITRGLDYYTGIVYETFLDALPAIGSVCSGGRYDDLAGLYSKERLPGVGASIGLDRLITALEVLNRSERKIGPSMLAIACLDEKCSGKYQALASGFRSGGIVCEVFSDQKKLGQQYALAERKGAAWILLASNEDLKLGTFTVRELATRENREGLSMEQALMLIKGSK